MERYFILSSDDNSIHDLRLAKLLDKHKLFATFFFNSGLIGQEDKIDMNIINEYFVSSKHCIGAHTLTHSVLSILDRKLFDKQIKDDKQNLEEIFKREINMFSYPGNADPIDVWSLEAEKYLKDLGFVSARHIYSTKDFGAPENPMRWEATGHMSWANPNWKGEKWEHDVEPFEMLEKFMSQDRGNLLHLWTHAWEWDESDWKMADSFFELIAKNNIKCISYSDYIKKFVKQA